METDAILVNGVIHTMEPTQPRASALWVRDGRVAAIGDDGQVRAAAGSARGARRVDLEGRCVLPGLVDAHLHFEGYSLNLERVDADLDRLDEVLAAVAARTAAVPEGEWIRGHGWNHNRWRGGGWPEGAFPTRQLLDRVAPRHPVYLTAKSGHAAWTNTAALMRCRVTRATTWGADGAVLRDEAGEPTGVFLEAAADLVARHLPEITDAQVAEAMVAGRSQAWRQGLTGVHDLDGVRSLRAWQYLRERAPIGLRVCKTIPVDRLDEAAATGIRSGFGDDWLWTGGVKLFADGALGPRTAWMLAPYCGEPDHLGMPLLAVDELRARCRQASRAGLACFVHAIGDRANREVLDALALVRAREREAGGRALRHRVEHAQVLDPADLPRFAALDVIAAMQPIHATSDMDMVDRLWGPERAPWAYAFASLRRTGTQLAFGSDAPVEPISPLAGIHAAVTRRRADGRPGPEGWQPAQRLTVLEAVRAYTVGAARAGGMEDHLGTLAPGMLADLVVLDADPFAIDPMAIAEVPVAATMCGGSFVHAVAELAVG